MLKSRREGDSTAVDTTDAERRLGRWAGRLHHRRDDCRIYGRRKLFAHADDVQDIEQSTKLCQASNFDSLNSALNGA